MKGGARMTTNGIQQLTPYLCCQGAAEAATQAKTEA